MVSLSRLFRSSFHHLLTLVWAALKNPWMKNQMKDVVVSLDGSDNGVGLPYRPFGMSRYIPNMDGGVCPSLGAIPMASNHFLFLPMKEQAL